MGVRCYLHALPFSADQGRLHHAVVPAQLPHSVDELHVVPSRGSDAVCPQGVLFGWLWRSLRVIDVKDDVSFAHIKVPSDDRRGVHNLNENLEKEMVTESGYALWQHCPPVAPSSPAVCCGRGTGPADLLPQIHTLTAQDSVLLSPFFQPTGPATCQGPRSAHFASHTCGPHDKTFSQHAETLGPGRKNVLTRRNRNNSRWCRSGSVECSRLASTGRWELDKDHTEGRGLSTGAEAALLRRDPGSGLRGARGATRHGVRGRVQGLGANLKFILYTVPT